MKKKLYSMIAFLFLVFGCDKFNDEPHMQLNKPETLKTMEMQVMFTSEPDSTIPIIELNSEEVGTFKIPNGDIWKDILP